MRNIGPYKNKSGIKGVYLRKGRWTANIKVNKVDHYLGSFDTKKEAAEARREAEEKYFGEYNYSQSIAAIPRIEGIPWAEPIGRFAKEKIESCVESKAIPVPEQPGNEENYCS